MAVVRNPFVDYLTRYTTASPDHEAAFDEFLAQAPPPAAGPLRLNTRVEAFLRTCFERSHPPSVILTGNAGDGKTYLCRQIVNSFTGKQITDWEAYSAQPIERDGIHLHVVKDLSELGDERGKHILRGLAASYSNANTHRYLIAANEGRLRALLSEDATQRDLYDTVNRQLEAGPDTNSPHLIIINLNAVTTSSFVPSALKWMTTAEHWTSCHACRIAHRCPIRHNAQRLSDERIAARVQMLYQLLEHLDIHVTVRDMLIHLAYTITGDRRCDELQRPKNDHANYSHYAYFVNIWGGEADSAFRRKASVVQHLDRLRIGDHSLFEIDDLIVSGGDDSKQEAEHQRLFAPAVDLDFRRFAQDREAYLHGSADSTAADEASAMLKWLPHCRRKLFFEWLATEKSNKLIPFLYFEQYLRLLAYRRDAEEQIRRHLVTGLNRAFSRLYLRPSEYLYVTTQYLHSGEQPRPLVRLHFPLTDIELDIEDRTNTAYDCDRRTLALVIAPPASLRRLPAHEQPAPLRWPFGLLQFEYLLRLAHGGTFNVLAEECELDIRNLKDRLLNTFSGADDRSGRLEFFVAESNRYTLRQLWIDEQSKIHGTS